MRTFVERLAAWHRLFIDLEHARVRLAQAEAAQPRDGWDREMQEDVRRLQCDCDQALGELHTAANAYMTRTRSSAIVSTTVATPPLRSN